MILYSNKAYYAGSLHVGMNTYAVMNETIFSNNNATYKGGAVVINRYSELVNTTYLSFYNNLAYEDGKHPAILVKSR